MPGLMPWATLVLGTLVLGFIWTLHYHQYDRARDDALAANASEHLNLATILAENFRQVTDRALVMVGQVRAGLEEEDGQWRLARLLASDPLSIAWACTTPRGARCSPATGGRSRCPGRRWPSCAGTASASASAPTCRPATARRRAPRPPGGCRC